MVQYIHYKQNDRFGRLSKYSNCF